MGAGDRMHLKSPVRKTRGFVIRLLLGGLEVPQ